MAEELGFLALGAGFATPQPLFFIHRRRWHHQMYMRVEVQAPGMGVQYGSSTGRALQGFVIQAEALYSFPGASKQSGIDLTLVLPRQGSKLGRQGKGEHKVLSGDALLLLSLNPPLAFMLLAVRATAVSTRMGYIAVLITFATGGQHQRCFLTSALLQDFECFIMAR